MNIKEEIEQTIKNILEKIRHTENEEDIAMLAEATNRLVGCLYNLKE